MEFFKELMLFYIIGCVLVIIGALIINNLAAKNIIDDNWYIDDKDDLSLIILLSWISFITFFILVGNTFMEKNPTSVITKLFFPKKKDD